MVGPGRGERKGCAAQLSKVIPTFEPERMKNFRIIPPWGSLDHTRAAGRLSPACQHDRACGGLHKWLITRNILPSCGSGSERPQDLVSGSCRSVKAADKMGMIMISPTSPALRETEKTRRRFNKIEV